MNKISSVLVVEDNDQTLAALLLLLSQGLAVAEVRASRSGEEALEALRHQPVALILSDYQLPGMDGVEVLETLRSRGDQTPFLLISGVPDKAGVLRAIAQSRAGVMGKPFRVSELEGTMHRLLDGGPSGGMPNVP